MDRGAIEQYKTTPDRHLPKTKRGRARKTNESETTVNGVYNGDPHIRLWDNTWTSLTTPGVSRKAKGRSSVIVQRGAHIAVFFGDSPSEPKGLKDGLEREPGKIREGVDPTGLLPQYLPRGVLAGTSRLGRFAS